MKTLWKIFQCLVIGAAIAVLVILAALVIGGPADAKGWHGGSTRRSAIELVKLYHLPVYHLPKSLKLHTYQGRADRADWMRVPRQPRHRHFLKSYFTP